jgi:transposase-like protein
MARVRTAAPKHQPTAPVADPAVIESTTLTVAMIQALIPLGLQAVAEALQAEVAALVGPRYTRHAADDARADRVRWGQQRGSIYLADQKLAVTVPRVRDQRARCEVPLATYRALQTPRAQDLGLFRRVLAGVSCREYHAAAEAVPEAFGLARSTVSRRFVRASARALRQLQERSLADQEWLVLLLDGKTCAADQVVLALGVTVTGEKHILGLVQTATENKAVCAAFLRELVERGFRVPSGLLVILDGAKGLRAAVRDVFGEVPVQRCQWHKRENVVRYLPTREQATWRRKLQAAYAQPTYAKAKQALIRLAAELRTRNASAAASLDEGLEETLTVHRLDVPPALRPSLTTTNLIESVMARVEAKTERIDHWRTSDQKLRWYAAALLHTERQFRRVKGYRYLPLLQRTLRVHLATPVTEGAAA